MVKDKFDLTGKTALVTGSARGIGRAIAIGLAECGAHVVVHGSRESTPLDEALTLVRNIDADAEKWVANLADPAAVETLPGGIDIVICNASTQSNVKWDEVSRETMLEQMQVNFNATFRIFQLCYPHMKKQGWGRMITVGSVQERRPHPEMCVYAASKSAQENLVRNLARQLAGEGITVNNLCPGVFATDRNKAALSVPEYARRITDAIPMHMYAMPDDAVGALLLLASDAGRYITGSTIMVDGGISLPG